MLRSMFAAVSGLQAHQTFMDVVGNNIANVNTTGFKAGTVEFEDLLSQTMNGAGAPASAIAGGTNPAQIGLGVRLAGIGTNFSQGAAQSTGRSTDFAIQGDGFFVVKQGGIQAYTRNGSFSLDGLGQLVTGDGGLVQGWQADPHGNVNTNSSTGPVKIPVGQTISPVTTGNINIGGNLPADSPIGTKIDVSIDVNNSLGASIPLRMEFTKVADTAGSVNWTVTTYDSANVAIGGPTAVKFDTAGNLTTPNITLTQAQLNTIPGTSGTWAAARRGAQLRHRDRGRPPHRRGDAQQRRGVVAGRFADRFAGELQHRPGRVDQRCVLERPHAGARPDRARRRSPTRPVCSSRAVRCSRRRRTPAWPRSVSPASAAGAR